MMSWESVFSLMFASVLIGFLLLTANTYKVDTTLYEYQIANDFAETIYKVTGSYDVTEDAKDVMSSLTKDSGYCISAEYDGEGIELYNTCPSSHYHKGTNVVSITRRVPGFPFKKVRYYVWK
ncbi:hypothetical protein J7J90_01370 [Candidatus Micrarchaeota archaeon]|nr:hypothetical protein [Candidatus Micrarchaeota archaeon]